MAMRKSTVKWFDAKKGYGFIHHPEGGDDVFVHYTQIESDEDFKTLRTGQSVEFEMNDGPKGLHALSVAALDDGTEEPAPDEENALASDPSSGASLSQAPSSSTVPTDADASIRL